MMITTIFSGRHAYQQVSFLQFRQAMAPMLYMDYMKEDLYLLRWLRGMNKLF